MLRLRPFFTFPVENQILCCKLQNGHGNKIGIPSLCIHTEYMRKRCLSTLSHQKIIFSSICKDKSLVMCLKPFASEAKQTPRERQIAETQEGGEVAFGKKVVQAGRDMTYLGVIIAGVGITALMFFAVGSELFSSKSPNSVYTKAFKLCKLNDEIFDTFGEPLKGYGEMNRRGRRRHVAHQEYEKDGVLYMRMKFYIEGPSGVKGTVHLEVKEDENKKYQYRYMFVDVETYPRKTIVIEDNR